MSLAAGTRLGPYEIVAPLGAGGMGEVYRARDARLHRDVAVKVLPDDVAYDPTRLARFAQEARAAAALNHPNILSVFDVAIDGPTPYLVSELLEGATLGERLRASAARVSTSRAVEYASQIARGLAAAHAHGIVHRDLKPDNVFITVDGRVKLLDFGLAKLSPPLGDRALTTDIGAVARTDAGQLLGTLSYMAPEQLRGQTVDVRADIFSFGAVLYEMLAGRRAFQAGSAADTINAILALDPPDVTPSGDPVPPVLARIVRRCLEKDPAARFQAASDLAFALDAVASGSSPNSADVRTTVGPLQSREWSAGAIVVASALLTALIALGAWAVWNTRAPRPTAPPASVVRFALYPPEGTSFSAGATARHSLSPDGRQIAFVAETASGTSLWVESLDSIVARRLPTTQGVLGIPIWSPDSRALAFLSDGKLKRIDVDGGVSRALCDLPVAVPLAALARGSWNRADVILFSMRAPGQAILRVSANGGEPKKVTQPAEGSGESHASAVFLPDGRHFVFVSNGVRERSGVWLGSLDQAQSVRLIDGARTPSYADGYLVFVRDGALMAQPFDTGLNRLTGEARSLGEAVRFGDSPTIDAASTVLVYNSGLTPDRQLLWVDRAGKELSSVGQPAPWGNFDLSPDETRVVASRGEAGLGGNLWLIDLSRDGLQTRLTFSANQDGSPVWSPDGLRIAFTRDLGARQQAIIVPAAGGPETVLYERSTSPGVILDDWSPDGRFITFNQDPSLMALSVDGGAKPFPFVQTQSAALDESHFSPDGKWIAYNSNESGGWQVYLAPWPATGERWQISANGGAEVRWRRDGRELYFLSLEGQMMAVDVGLAQRPRLGVPRALFHTGITLNPRQDHFAVSSDGQRFLLRRQVVAAGRFPLTVVLNWRNALAQPAK